MKQATLRLTAFFMLIAVTTSKINAQTKKINVVTTAVPFLRITPDSRAGGMGELGIATSADANLSFWNLAKAPFATNKMSISASYTPWLSDLKLNDVYLASLAGYYQLDETQAVSASLRYFSLGTIQFTDATGLALNQYRPREFAIDGGYSRKLSSKMGLGVAVRYISSSLASGQVATGGPIYKPGTSICGDIHWFYKGTKDGNGLDCGATLSNLGSKISYTNDAQKDYIPANLGIGATYNKKLDPDNNITFGMDLNKLLVPTAPMDANGNIAAADLEAYRSKGVVSSWFSSLGDGEDFKEISVSVGAEYWYKNQFALRAGYFYEDKLKGDRKYFTLGAGLKYNTTGLNFSYLLPTGSGVNRNPLSNTLRFSLVFDMAKK